MTLPMCFMILYEMVPVFLTRKKVNESFPIIPVHYKASLREFWGKPLSTSAGLPFKSKQLNCAKNQSLYVYLLKITVSLYTTGTGLNFIPTGNRTTIISVTTKFTCYIWECMINIIVGPTSITVKFYLMSTHGKKLILRSLDFRNGPHWLGFLDGSLNHEPVLRNVSLKKKTSR